MYSQIIEKAAHLHVCNYYGIYVHVHFIASVTIWHVLYILVNTDKIKRNKLYTTCKHYLARQECSIDLYSLRRN